MNTKDILPFLMAAFNMGGNGIPKQPTGGHREKGYIPTVHDLDAIDMANIKRTRKAAKHHRDYLRCLANDPCRRVA